MKNKALLLDRDGVINKITVDNGKACLPKTFEDFELLDGVKEALIISKNFGYLNIIVTNQPDLATQKINLRSDLESQKRVKSISYFTLIEVFNELFKQLKNLSFGL